jgi:hypothetical protein
MVSSAVWGKADYARLDAGFAIAIEVASDWRSFWAVVVVREGRYTVLACCANLAICPHVWVLARSRGIVRHIASRVAVLTTAVGVTGVWLGVGVMRCRGSHLQEVLDLVHGADAVWERGRDGTDEIAGGIGGTGLVMEEGELRA